MAREFCALCGLTASQLTIDTSVVDGKLGTREICRRCWVKIHHPERLQKPKEPTTIVQNTAVREEHHTIQKAEDDPYKKVEGHIGEVKKETPDYVESVEKVKE